jgi:dihydrofolate reductase
MRKIIFLMHVSLDGYVAGPNGEMDWIGYNDELVQYSASLHDSTDAVIYGRVTFQMMEYFFPKLLENPEMGGESDLKHAQWLDAATKYVFSRTLDHSDWKNTVFIHDNFAEEVRRIKEQPGKDIWMIASATLAQEFMRLGLIDEYRLNVNPVVLGGGKLLFDGLNEEIKLNLIEARTMMNGVVALRYAPAAK